MKAIFNREFKSYFQRMSGYAFIGACVFCVGALVTYYSLFYGMPSLVYALSDAMLVIALIIPAFALSAISGERKNGTDRLLSMLPVSRAQIVVGKYLALVAVFSISVAFCGLFPLWLDMIGEVNFATSYAGLLCYALFGAAMIAISLFISAAFDNLIIAAVVNYGALVVLYLLGTLASALIPFGWGRDIVLSLSLFGRFDSFIYGAFDLGAVIYYAIVAVVFLLLGIHTAEKRRLF